MNDHILIDLTDSSFEEFVDFLFSRETPSEGESLAALAERGETRKWKPWYWHTKVVFDPLSVRDHYVRLFRDPLFLLDRFTKAQLEQGFWAAQGPNLDCSAAKLVWNKDIPLPLRAEFVGSMVPLFELLFAKESLEDSVSMWWDSACYCWHCGNRKRSRGGEDLAMQDIMFEALVAILANESETCQAAALHGLSHLHHPETEVAVQNYLSRNPLLDETWRKVALAAARFELM